MSSTHHPTNVQAPRILDKSGESILRRQSLGFLPGWDERAQRGALVALLDVAGHYNDLVQAALADAQVKAKLVALDAMGTSLRDSSSASSVAVFTAAESLGGEPRSVPAGTLIAAAANGSTVGFETDNDLELITAALDQVIEIRNGQLYDLKSKGGEDSEATILVSVRSIFIQLKYSVFCNAHVDIDMTYSRSFSSQATMHWQLWTGTWADLDVEVTEIDEHNRPVRVRLTNSSGKQSVVQELTGVNGHWIRLVDASPDFQQQTEGSSVTIDRVRVITNLKHSDALPLEYVVVNQQKVDPTAAIAPFGEAPRPGASMAMACSDVFARPATTVTFHYKRVTDGANAADAAENEAPQAAKVMGKAAALTRVGLNPLALLAAMHELARETVPFYALFSRVLFELMDLVLEASKAVVQSVSRLGASALRRLGVSDPVLYQPKSVTRKRQNSNEANDNDQSPPTAGPMTILERWNGTSWSPVVTSEGLPVTSERLPTLTLDGTAGQSVTFSLTGGGAQLGQLYGQKPAHWLRVRFVSGVFGDWLTVNQTHVQGNGEARFLLSKPPRIDAVSITFEHADEYGAGSQTNSSVNAFAVTEYRRPERDKDDPTKEFLAQRYSCHVSTTLTKMALPEGYYLGFDGTLPEGWVGIFARTNSTDSEGSSKVATEAPITAQYWTSPDNAPSDGALHVESPRQDAPGFQPCSSIESRNLGLSLGTVIRMLLSDTETGRVIPVRVVSRTRLQVASPLYFAEGRLLSALDLYPPGMNCILRDDNGFVKVTVERHEKDGWKLSHELSRTFGSATIEPVRPELFGVRRSWLRLCNLPGRVDRFESNAIGVTQAETHKNEVLGNSTGEPSQAFRPRFSPILRGECLEVLELEGKRAEVEFDLLREEVESTGGGDSIRVDRNPTTGRIEKVWVQWQRRNSLVQSASRDRHYSVDQQRGLILFGDGIRGRIPPASSLIMLRIYRHGGGRQGNVGPGTIQQVLSPGLSTISVNNPIRGEGGNDADSLEESWDKGEMYRTRIGPSRTERFLRQNTLFRAGYPSAIDAADFETIARRSSSAIAEAVMLNPPQPQPGEPIRYQLVILPFEYRSMLAEGQSRPQRVLPPASLQNVVSENIDNAAAPWVRSRLEIVGPEIVWLGIEITTQSLLSSSEAQELLARVHGWMHDEYFNAVSGGPSELGWLSAQKVPVRDSELMERLHRFDSRIQDCQLAEYDDGSAGPGQPMTIEQTELKPGQIPVVLTLRLGSSVSTLRPDSLFMREDAET